MNQGDVMLLYVGNIFYILTLGSIYTMFFMAVTFVQSIRYGFTLNDAIHSVIRNTLTFYPVMLFLAALVFAMKNI